MSDEANTEPTAPDGATGVRVRREPPAFRLARVREVSRLTPRMVRVSVSGPALVGFAVDLPAASLRLLVPSPGESELVVPTWTGNEFLLPGGERPTLRTFTPRHVDPSAGTLVLDIVVHEGGAVSTWAEAADDGCPVAISGPGRGYTVGPTSSAFLLLGDESAMPAISQLLEVLPSDRAVRVVIAVRDSAARMDLPARPGSVVEWREPAPGSTPGDALVEAAREAELGPGTSVWAAGEASAMHRIRRHLFEERGLPRSSAVVRGYWKLGRVGDAAGTVQS